MRKLYSSLFGIFLSLNLFGAEAETSYPKYFIVEQSHQNMGQPKTELTIYKVEGDAENHWLIEDIDLGQNKIVCQGGDTIYLESANLDVSAFLQYFGHCHRKYRNMRLNPSLYTPCWSREVPGTYSSLKDAVQRNHVKFLCDFAMDGTYSAST